MSNPKYPHVQVSVRSANPLVAISAVRGALRRAGVARCEIDRFTGEAFASADLLELRATCDRWARVEAPSWSAFPGCGVPRASS